VAEVDDAVIAAIDLTSGAIVADPSRSMSHTVHALRRAATSCCARAAPSATRGSPSRARRTGWRHHP
jgi:hypothetical protein